MENESTYYSVMHNRQTGSLLFGLDILLALRWMARDLSQRLESQPLLFPWPNIYRSPHRPRSRMVKRSLPAIDTLFVRFVRQQWNRRRNRKEDEHVAAMKEQDIHEELTT